MATVPLEMFVPHSASDNRTAGLCSNLGSSEDCTCGLCCGVVGCNKNSGRKTCAIPLSEPTNRAEVPHVAISRNYPHSFGFNDLDSDRHTCCCLIVCQREEVLVTIPGGMPNCKF